MEPEQHRWQSARPADSGAEWPEGWHVWHISETGSTNADLLGAAARGEPNRTVLRADHQTAGRGRLDRTWEAPPNSNLLVSILFRDVPSNPAELTQRVALAAIEASREVSAKRVVLKWPNDLMVDDQKLGGILAQRSSDGSVVVGLGLNVGWAPPGAVRLESAASVDDLLTRLLRCFDALPADIHATYVAALATLGTVVRVRLPVGELLGTAVDVDHDGRLILLDQCAVTHQVDVGDVVHVRPA